MGDRLGDAWRWMHSKRLVGCQTRSIGLQDQKPTVGCIIAHTEASNRQTLNATMPLHGYGVVQLF